MRWSAVRKRVSRAFGRVMELSFDLAVNSFMACAFGCATNTPVILRSARRARLEQPVPAKVGNGSKLGVCGPPSRRSRACVDRPMRKSPTGRELGGALQIVLFSLMLA